MKTTVTVDGNQFTITLQPMGADDINLPTYVERYGYGDVGWGNIKIEGQWLGGTYDWQQHSHWGMVEVEAAFEFGGGIPLNQLGLDMACRRVQWLASRESALVTRWLYLKIEREQRSQVGEVARNEVQEPVTVVKPWREGANPHPEAIVYDLPGCKGSLPWWHTLPAPEGTPSGHPRFLCHFPSSVSQDEWFGKKHVVKARVWKTAHREDNGPSYNYSTVHAEVLEGEFKGVFLGQKAVGFHFEPIAVTEQGKEIGWFGELPETPAPSQPPAPYRGGEVCCLNGPRKHTTANGEAVETNVRLYVYWPEPVKVLRIKA